MKKQFTMTIVLFFTVITSEAKIDLHKYQKTIADIQTLESAKKYLTAAVTAAAAANEIADAVG